LSFSLPPFAKIPYNFANDLAVPCPLNDDRGIHRQIKNKKKYKIKNNIKYRKHNNVKCKMHNNVKCKMHNNVKCRMHNNVKCTIM
jgi:hypothetical protein